MKVKVQLILTVIGTALEMFFAGAIYGWPSLQPVLIGEGYFSQGCQPENTTNITATATKACKSQIEQLNLVFTVVTSLPPVIAIGIGYILDRYGTWVTRTLILLTMFAGIEITAWTTPDHSWVLLISLSLCNLAGYGLLFANLTIGNLVPYYRASIVTIMCGAFDSATSVFLLFRYLYEMGVSFRMMFQVYACVVLIFMVQTFLLTPMKTAPYVLPDGYVYGYRELGCCRTPEEEEDPVYSEVRKEVEEVGDPEDNPDSQTFKECVKEAYTWTEVIHYCIVHFTVTSFIGNFNNWITTKVEPHQIGFYTTAFGSIQSLGFFVAPFSGLLIDKCRRRFSKSLGLMLGSFKSVTVLLFINDFLLITMLLLSLMPSAELQFVTMVLQVISSAFVYSTVAAFASAVYPTQHFGVLYSCTEAIGGVFLLLQYPVTLLVTRVLDNNFALVNGVLLGLCCVNLLHPLYLLRIIGRRSRKRELRMEKSYGSTTLNNRSE